MIWTSILFSRGSLQTMSQKSWTWQFPATSGIFQRYKTHIYIYILSVCLSVYLSLCVCVCVCTLQINSTSSSHPHLLKHLGLVSVFFQVFSLNRFNLVLAREDCLHFSSPATLYLHQVVTFSLSHALISLRLHLTSSLTWKQPHSCLSVSHSI